MTIAVETNKLTVNLPETLRRKVKAVAALRGETVSDIVRSALESYVSDALEEQDDVRMVQAIEARISNHEGRTYSHEEIWAEIDALEAQGALPN